MSATFNVTLNMTAIVCVQDGCGITFGVPYWWEQRRREDHTSWYCPNGHKQFFDAETEEEKLKKQLAEKDRMLSVRQTMLDDARKQTETLLRSNRSVRVHSKLIKTRVAAGVCPVGCKRHFTNLQRHIETKHPTWKSEEEK